MRRFRLRSFLALIGVIALSLWVGMQLERAKSRRVRPVMQTRTYTVMRPTTTYTVIRPVRQLRP